MLRTLPMLLPSLLLACGLPRDPQGTRERVGQSHVLKVGVTSRPPWTVLTNGDPPGIEPDLTRRFAARLGAHIVWTRGSESELAEKLQHHRLDLALGGFDQKTQWRKVVAVTRPFAVSFDKKKHVLLAAPGENAFALALDRFLADPLRGRHGALE